MTTDDVYGAFYDDATSRGFLHSHSYTGNPLACRAALAVLDIFAQDDVLAANRLRGAALTQLLEPLANHPRVRHFRNRGMIWAFDVADAGADFSRRLFTEGLQRELLLRPIGNTVYLMPPYVMDETASAFLAESTLLALNATLTP
jgi:adenosylmethionine---8-amino-7-oxononanoate aminotransferase